MLAHQTLRAIAVEAQAIQLAVDTMDKTLTGHTVVPASNIRALALHVASLAQLVSGLASAMVPEAGPLSLNAEENYHAGDLP